MQKMLFLTNELAKKVRNYCSNAKSTCFPPISRSQVFTVEEYKKHNLAEHSDDEKRIFSAERRARLTLSTLKKKRSTSFAEDKRPSLVRTSVHSTTELAFCLSSDGRTTASSNFKVTTRSG